MIRVYLIDASGTYLNSPRERKPVIKFTIQPLCHRSCIAIKKREHSPTPETIRRCPRSQTEIMRIVAPEYGNATDQTIR